jgi:hypothetical protein
MMTKQRPRRARVLTNVRVDEISAVDAGAGEGVQIMLMKRASDNKAVAEATARLAASVKSIVSDAAVTDKGAMLAKTFAQYQEHLNKLTKNDSERSEPNLSNTDAGYGGRRRRRSDDDDETERLSDDADADDDDEKEKEAMTAKLKSLDAVQICKQMVDEGDAHSMSEHDLVSLVDNFAKAHNSTFVALYERNDDTGLAIRKAVDIAKHAGFGVSSPYLKAATLEPKQVGSRAARNVDDPRSALDQINDLIAEQRRQYPELELTDAQWFARVYSDPANRDIAKRERRENRPVPMGW